MIEAASLEKAAHHRGGIHRSRRTWARSRKDARRNTQACRVDAECLERRLLLSTVSFQPREIYNTGTDPFSVAVADLGNGHQHIVVANNYDNTVSVLLGNGNGTFQPQKVFYCGGAPIAVAIADLGNGHPDIVVANTTANSVNVTGSA